MFRSVPRGRWDVFQWWRSTLRASHRSAGRHWEVMGRSLLMFMSMFCFAMTFDAIWVSVMWAALPLSRRFPLSRRRGWWGPASRPETLTTTLLSSESKPTPPTRTSSSSSLSRWRSRQVRSRPSESCLSFNTLSFPAPGLMFFSFSSAAPGIYSSTEMLDFGTLRSQGTQSLKKKRHPKVFL